MQFGMFFELQLPRPWTVDSERTLVRNALEWAEIGDRIGIEYAWAQEHHFLEEYSHSTAPEVFLSAVSQRTKRMRIGHGITLMPPAYNHPARVAERISMLDLVSDGRVEWGTGESSSRLELEGFNIPYIEKRAMWAECVREAAKMMCSEPYPGHKGEHFSMPSRNIIPKPVQRPHPPLWVACTNRDTLKLAARLGIGALTFSFMDAGEASYWVKEYYDIFKNECTPIGQTVNPNVAMLAGLFCDRDEEVARRRGIPSQQFFKWGLAHYYRHGEHVPGRTNLWETFQKADPEPMAGIGGVGTPEQIRAHFKDMEDAGVDQLILLQQAGDYTHEHICASMELAGQEVFPEFLERHEKRRAEKAEELAPYIAKALERRPPIAEPDLEVVESYPKLWEKQEGLTQEQMGSRRAQDATLLWRLHVGGGRDRADG